MLSSFPLCLKGWLEVKNVLSEDLKSRGNIPQPSWHSKFCVLLENDSKLYIFNDEISFENLSISSHIAQCRLDTELNSLYSTDSLSCIDDVSSMSSKLRDSERYSSNLSLNNGSHYKSQRRRGLFRNGSRILRLSKTFRKLSDQSHTNNRFENNHSTKSVSDLKRTWSLNRLHRKKSEEKLDSKVPSVKIKNSQSTGDLTLDSSSSPIICHNLSKDANVSEVHASLVGERPYCFRVTSFVDEMIAGSNIEDKCGNSVYSTTYIAASSHLERKCWMKRLQLTLKPNMENEKRLNNSIKLTIFESKQLPTPKKRYFCEVNLDKNLYAKTTSKLSGNDGNVFWAEDFIFNNLPTFKTLTISLYKEIESGKDLKKKKKKQQSQSQCIGQQVFNLSTINSKEELQSWYNLRSTDFIMDRSSSNAIQIRIKLRYQSLKVLTNDIYQPLYEITTTNYLELIQFLDKNLPIKLKEEIAVCLVNIHEKNGTIIKFVSDLIFEEINDIDNSSMILRANTIVTKIIESHMKLVGFQYLQSMLRELIRNVMSQDIAIEVDCSRFDQAEVHKEKLLHDNQQLLTDYLKQVWLKIYESRNLTFPIQLKSVFAGWRRKLLFNVTKDADIVKLNSHCDIIVSGCIFLRFLCPAILSPHLFGLVSHFSENMAVQRTLTLLAKSLQSLANLLKFGEKEQFMTFLNSCFENEIPRMYEFLRTVSSIESSIGTECENTALSKDIYYYGVAIDLPVEMARLHNCLMSDEVKKLQNNSSKLQSITNLSDIINHIGQQLICFNVTESSSSFFPIKKSITTNMLSLDQRRISDGQLLNAKSLETWKQDKDPSPPLLGSPIFQTQLLDYVSEYDFHNDETWQQKQEIKNTENIKHILNNSMKSPFNLSSISKSQVDVLGTKRSHHNIQEIKLDSFGQSDLKANKQKFVLPISNNTDNRYKSLIVKNIVPVKNKTIIKSEQEYTKEEFPLLKPQNLLSKGYDQTLLKHHATKSNTCYQTLDLYDGEFYRENPLYDFIDISRESSEESRQYCSNAIDRYFNIQTQINLLERNLRLGNKKAENHLKEVISHLRQQLSDIKIQINKDQVNDLKQLNTMLHLSKISASERLIPRSNSSYSKKSNQDNFTSEAFDNVIKSITSDEADLEKAQENLRRHVKKQRSPVKPRKSLDIHHSRKSSIEFLINSRTEDHTIHTVPIEFFEQISRKSDPSSSRIQSSSSSNTSSLMSALI